MDIASYIDHTILKPTTTAGDVERLCREAVEMQFAAVCVPPYYVGKAREGVAQSGVKVATVIGFPMGYSISTVKLQEMVTALDAGADEVDIVHNIAAVKNGDWQYAEDEIALCTALAHMRNAKVKVIVESGLLTDDEIIKCCDLYARHGIDMMKTSTGYAETGATVHAVALMRQHLPASVGIKASGGIRTFAFAKELIEAGATRIGCSAGMQIVKESKE